jgi:hypothetical protein
VQTNCLQVCLRPRTPEQQLHVGQTRATKPARHTNQARCTWKHLSTTSSQQGDAAPCKHARRQLTLQVMHQHTVHVSIHRRVMYRKHAYLACMPVGISLGMRHHAPSRTFSTSSCQIAQQLRGIACLLTLCAQACVRSSRKTIPILTASNKCSTGQTTPTHRAGPNMK